LIEILQFFFQDIWHWIGGLIYIWSSVLALGLGLGLVTEALKGK
jgi:hypothetical protein